MHNFTDIRKYLFGETFLSKVYHIQMYDQQNTFYCMSMQ